MGEDHAHDAGMADDQQVFVPVAGNDFIQRRDYPTVKLLQRLGACGPGVDRVGPEARQL